MNVDEELRARPVTWRAWHYRLLWLVALTSLLINVVLVTALFSFRARLQESVTAFNETLAGVDLTDIELAVAIDETLPISTTIFFSDTFLVPISATIPVSTSILFEDVVQVPIRTTIPIDTDFVVQVDIPLVGRTGIPIPIVTNIPVNLTVDVPISRQIPVETDIAVNITVSVPVESELAVQTEVPVQLEFPVIVSLDELGVHDLIDQLRQALEQLAGTAE